MGTCSWGCAGCDPLCKEPPPNKYLTLRANCPPPIWVNLTGCSELQKRALDAVRGRKTAKTTFQCPSYVKPTGKIKNKIPSGLKLNWGPLAFTGAIACTSMLPTAGLGAVSTLLLVPLELE